MDGDGGRREMVRGRLEVLVDNAWRTHDGRRGGEGCYDARRGVLHRDPRASPWPFRVTGMSYARARQRPKGLTVSQCARFGAASGRGRACGEKRRSVGQRAAPRTAGHPERGRDTCGSEGRSPPRQALPQALATRRACCRKARRRCPSSPMPTEGGETESGETGGGGETDGGGTEVVGLKRSTVKR